MRTVLTIAGSDSIGGAGVQADLKAIASLDLHGASALTAVTAQNTKRVERILPLDVSDVIAQIDAVMDDSDVSAIKTGMLFSAEIAEAVSNRLKGLDIPIVVDPVMIAGVGDRLCSDGLLTSLRRSMLPLATVVTPNKEEAESLSGKRICSLDDAVAAAVAIKEMGPRAVLIKGGHLEGNGVIDLLYVDGKMIELKAPRWPVKVHGAGCTLASYIAGNISRGMEVRSAVMDAKRRVTDAIALSYPIGEGMNAINPMASKQKEAMRGERIESLRWMVERLEEGLPASWVPTSGGDVVYSLPAPQGFSEVCGIEGGLVIKGGRPRRIGDVRFDASRELASVAIGLSIHDLARTTVLALRGSERNIKVMKRSGMMWADYDLQIRSRDCSAIAETVGRGIEQTGFVPDIIFERDGMGTEPMILVNGRSPSDVLRKIGPVLH
ncbi:MAG: bifunctional hydroxymethylpyrimidine kinase/phosphomethylpyrimidine kinase [Methanomassiliicoccales archaeon]|nr:MAG: bifunctional hydroxymethylpyrimidine kinase/phosphomethylpyrimidine kinase [Methanomassiliicoccales archaeon]